MTETMSQQAAWHWYAGTSPIRGCNYLPHTAVNVTEMWQGETFDPATIDRELGWAEAAGYNSLRVFLQYLVWRDDPVGLLSRLDRFLQIAHSHGMRAMLVPFCDCSFSGREPYLGPQDAPISGVHNSGWVPSPGLARVTDRSAWPDLERYVTDLVSRFGQDERVLVWDLYNESGNSNMGERSLPLVEAAFQWARAANPAQPLTVGLWNEFEGPMSRRLAELSDVVSFHAYEDAQDVEAKIELCRSYGRPLLCTEWLRRQAGNTFAAILPLFHKYQVGWYHWGLVAGKTQTYMPWGSKPGNSIPDVWQHDVFYPDGQPYNAIELELVRTFTFRACHQPSDVVRPSSSVVHRPLSTLKQGGPVDLLQLVELLELADMDQKTSYATPLKLVALGKIMGLGKNSRVIDIGCAKAKALILWARYFGISGLGVELSEGFCEEAAERIQEEGLTDRIQIVCHAGDSYAYEPGGYDVACCIGASFIWGGFRPTLQALKQIVADGGQIVIGEPYYTQKEVPQELIDFEGEYHTEVELLDIIHEEGCELGHILRANSDDRDWYTAAWPYEWKRIYLEHMRPLEGWAMYLIRTEPA